MPFPPKPKDDATGAKPPGGDDASGGAPPPPPGDDLEGGGEINAPGAGGDAAGDTALIHKLSQSIAELGMVVEPIVGMDLRNYVEHLCTAVATHKATKNLGGDPADDPSCDQNQQQQQALEPEVAESTPNIMMSQAEATALRARATRADALEARGVKREVEALKGRIGVLLGRGYIDRKIEQGMLGRLDGKAIKLSLADDGQLRGNDVAVEVAAYERIMQSGKPGSFAPEARRQTAARAPDPNKPISTALSQTTATEEVVPAPYGDTGDDDEPAPVDPHVAGLMSQGRWKPGEFATKR